MDAGQLLDGRRVLVVGGAGLGNGRGISRGVAAAGARVAIVGINPDRAQEAAKEITARGGDALPLVGDVRSGTEVDRLLSEAVAWLGGLDSLVTVVGGYSLFTAWTPLADVTDEQYGHQGIRMNVVSCGVIATEAQQANFPNGGGIAERVPACRAGKPEEIAAAVVFLASPYASYISGQNLTADGSLTSRFPLPLPGIPSYIAG